MKALACQCRFFKGEPSAPAYFSEKQRKCWLFEREWAELLADSYTNRDKLVANMEAIFGEVTFHKKMKMPKSLFAFYMSKCASSPFVHEWLFDVFILLSGTYSQEDPHKLFEEFRLQH